MIDNTKYLSWLDNDSPVLEDEMAYCEMCSKIGHILHVIQMIEYNIANILSLEEFERINGRPVTTKDIEQIKVSINEKYGKLAIKTFGQLKAEIKKSKCLTNVDIEELSKIVEYRNYIVHHCFKEKLLRDELSTFEDVDEFIDELNEYDNLIRELNDQLVEIFKQNKIKQVINVKNGLTH